MPDRSQLNDVSGRPPTSAVVTEVSSQILSGNKKRTALWILNEGNRTVFLAFGHEAVAGKGVRIVMNEMAKMVGSDMLPLEPIFAITEKGESLVAIQEWE